MAFWVLSKAAAANANKPLGRGFAAELVDEELG
jgi:hypothetical protein